MWQRKGMGLGIYRGRVALCKGNMDTRGRAICLEGIHIGQFWWEILLSGGRTL